MIYVVETIDATPGNTDKLKEELLKIVTLSRKEQGCRSYDLFRDRDHPNRFLVTILFDNQAAYDAHINSPHIQALDSALYCNVIEHLYTPISK